MTIIARETLDCAAKVRIHYVLAEPVSPEFLTRLANYELSIQPFSQIVAGAKDHFVACCADVRASGIIGDRDIVATFGKTGGARPVESIENFETLLRQLTDDLIERIHKATACSSTRDDSQ